MAKKIRDTIHGYIYLTRLEEAVSQHPLVLRLHYIHQTSFTYLTYPNAHSTRYPHSLGVMHVSGEIFQSALVNTPPSVLGNIATRVKNVLGSTYPSLEREFASSESGVAKEALYQSLRWGSRQRASSDLRLTVIDDVDVFLLMTVLFQATRLAALLHDIGHPPFSHIVEYALLQSNKSQKLPEVELYPGHEKVGEHLLDLTFHDGSVKKRSGYTEAPNFADACFKICSEILHGGEKSPFRGLEDSLLSGPIDADRLDYVRRDAYSAGMVPAYDIRRLVDASFFRICDGGRNFEVAFRPNCLSSFENFFQARYDLYRYMIYHHDVVRRNLAIQRLLVMTLNPDRDVPDRAKEIAAQFYKYASGLGDTKYQIYQSFVDSYLLQLLWQLDEIVRDPEGGASRDCRRMRLYIDVVLRRRNDKLRTLLKRPEDYASFAEEVMGRLPKHMSREGRRILEPVPALNAQLKRRLTAFAAAADENVAKLHLAEAIEAKLAQVVRDGQGGDAELHCYYVGTFNAGPKRKVAFSEPESEPNTSRRTIAEDVSPTIAMLERAWSYSPQITFFFHMPGDGTSAQAPIHRAILRPMAVDGMVAFLEAQ